MTSSLLTIGIPRAYWIQEDVLELIKASFLILSTIYASKGPPISTIFERRLQHEDIIAKNLSHGNENLIS